MDALEHFPKDIAKVFVYIEEAHALDEWNIGLNGNCSQINHIVCSLNQHKSNEERVNALSLLLKKSPSWLAESYLASYATVESKMSEQMNTWPFAIWLVKNQTIIDMIHPSNDDGTLFDIFQYAIHIQHIYKSFL